MLSHDLEKSLFRAERNRLSLAFSALGTLMYNRLDTDHIGAGYYTLTLSRPILRLLTDDDESIDGVARMALYAVVPKAVVLDIEHPPGKPEIKIVFAPNVPLACIRFFQLRGAKHTDLESAQAGLNMLLDIPAGSTPLHIPVTLHAELPNSAALIRTFSIFYTPGDDIPNLALILRGLEIR